MGGGAILDDIKYKILRHYETNIYVYITLLMVVVVVLDDIKYKILRHYETNIYVYITLLMGGGDVLDDIKYKILNCAFASLKTLYFSIKPSYYRF